MPDVVDECVNILSRLTIASDPGTDMNKLVDLFGQRKLFVDILMNI
jgi:hypothetical protein